MSELKNIRLEDLLLDYDNPRFVVSTRHRTEQEIFDYLLEYEALKETIDNIRTNGFFKVGDRPIVIESSIAGKYIVKEGNRRICALKALHGYFNKTYSFPDNFKNDSLTVQCDYVDDLSEIEAYVAQRHLIGVQQWKPEAKRNFFSKHYKDGKTIDQIFNISKVKKNEIINYLRDTLFLDFFKKESSHEKIDAPSFVYDRLYKFCSADKIIQPIDVKEEYVNSIVTPTSFLTELEIKDFFSELYEACYGDNSYVNSRTANKLTDFNELLNSETAYTNSPRMVELFKKIMSSVAAAEFIPFQKINSCFVGKVPAIDDIIDYHLLPDATIKIYDSDMNEITKADFVNGTKGKYTITINSSSFYFNIESPVSVSFYKYESQLIKPQKICTNIDLSSFITIFDEYKNKVSLTSPLVRFESADNLPITEIEFLTGGIVHFYSARDYQIRIIYENGANVGRDIITIKAAPYVGTVIPATPDKFFDFKFIDAKARFENIIEGKLIIELEDAFSQNHVHIFASALRSLIEVLLYDFIDNAHLSGQNAVWNNIRKNDTNNCLEKIFRLQQLEFKNICSAYDTKEGTSFSTSMKNYFETNLVEANLVQIRSAFNLGAHKSTKILAFSNILDIKPYVNALIELVCAVETINFQY